MKSIVYDYANCVIVFALCWLVSYNLQHVMLSFSEVNLGKIDLVKNWFIWSK